jgi:hypothetical protein
VEAGDSRAAAKRVTTPSYSEDEEEAALCQMVRSEGTQKREALSWSCIVLSMLWHGWDMLADICLPVALHARVVW